MEKMESIFSQASCDRVILRKKIALYYYKFMRDAVVVCDKSNLRIFATNNYNEILLTSLTETLMMGCFEKMSKQ